MLTTEKEAARKSCARDPHRALCIGSACMAWRWMDGYGAFRDPNANDYDIRWCSTPKGEKEARAAGLEELGRCGLVNGP